MMEPKIQSKTTKLLPQAREILMLAEQRGFDRSDVINAAILTLGRVVQPHQDRFIKEAAEASKKAQEAEKLPEPVKSPT